MNINFKHSCPVTVHVSLYFILINFMGSFKLSISTFCQSGLVEKICRYIQGVYFDLESCTVFNNNFASLQHRHNVNLQYLMIFIPLKILNVTSVFF